MPRHTLQPRAGIRRQGKDAGEDGQDRAGFPVAFVGLAQSKGRAGTPVPILFGMPFAQDDRG